MRVGSLISVSERALLGRVEVCCAPPILTFRKHFRHLGATVIFCSALTSHFLLCSVSFSGRKPAVGCNLNAASPVSGLGLLSALPPVNTECSVLCTRKAICLRHFADAREGSLNSLEVNYGTCSLQKVSA